MKMSRLQADKGDSYGEGTDSSDGVLKGETCIQFNLTAGACCA
jgi:hypothetical protein